MSSAAVVIGTLRVKRKNVYVKEGISFNLIALRRAKTLRSFGLSECNRVKSRPL